jgi:hypothetical protein
VLSLGADLPHSLAGLLNGIASFELDILIAADNAKPLRRSVRSSILLRQIWISRMTLSCQRTDVFVGSSERMNARREGFIEIKQPVPTLVDAPQLGLYCTKVLSLSDGYSGSVNEPRIGNREMGKNRAASTTTPAC